MMFKRFAWGIRQGYRIWKFTVEFAEFGRFQTAQTRRQTLKASP